ncbi:Predicted oxidoreductase [Actinopolymorpha cephalotaxi]|uniref:Predicted oxidoreductase n=1 Tax=Actinopolymorpha cephalotaxi TaxID=504797 RepID=A0A1I2PP58_9ACTN|nr:aldo/keto reductase [Actinopolymorpha cephalotaxi]NYH83597.1 aryl-alcohol dehydrogenase-like predicted oxidoreductase [Actinopolymorpha cephalotaxi]SFG15807.1 Predicted oxidoreductase [Actinopolymorpha cephalotaxi]
MEHRYLGRTGLRVSELCLGTMSFGQSSDEATSHKMLDRFVEAGGTFVDTADVYGTGTSEEVVGRWLATKNRDDIVLATKVYGQMGPGQNDTGAGRKHIMAAVDASLRRLGTDHIDLYQVHVFDDGTPMEETLGTLDRLVQSGKVRFVGASNYTGWQLQKSIDLARHNGWEPFACLQPLYNLLDRSAELELVPVCEREGVGLIAWSPLRGGWLSGKYRRGASGAETGSRVDQACGNDNGESWDRYATERTWTVLDALHDIAGTTGHSVAQVALRWVAQRPGVTSPIIGARTMEQFEDNLGAAGWSLTSEQMARLDEASEFDRPYPYGLLRSFVRRPA